MFQAALVATQRLYCYEGLLGVLKPRAVLVEYDRNLRSACLVLAAKKLGIPTLTLVHGVVNGPFGYTPVLADEVLCWGGLQRQQFIQFGTPAERTEIVGFERLDPNATVNPKEVRERVGIPEAVTVAILATNPIEAKSREILARAFCEAVSCAGSEIAGIVRLHPSETLGFYGEVRSEFPTVRFMEHGELSQEEAFSLVDIAVVHSSGFGAEAVMMGAACVVLDVLDAPLGYGANLVRHGGAQMVRDASELSLTFSMFHSDPTFNQRLRQSAQQYAKEMYFAFGDEACGNIASAVLRA